MSYILEAIKRSERERLSASVSRLPVLPVFGEAEKPSPFLLYGAISIALMAAGIAIGWLRPWQSGNATRAPVIAKAAPESNAPAPAADAEAGQAGPAPLATTPTMEMPAAPAIEKAEALHVMKVKPYHAPRHVRRDRPSHMRTAARTEAKHARHTPPPAGPRSVAAVPTAARAAPPATSSVTIPVAPTRARAIAPAATQPSVAVASVATPIATRGASSVAAPVVSPGTPAATAQHGTEHGDTATDDTAPATPGVAAASAAPRKAARGQARVVSLYDLPPEIQRKLPPMSISGFTLSDTPKGRMVYINDHLLQEGQYVANGLKLEQITADGLIFSYRHYRFRKNLQ